MCIYLYLCPYLHLYLYLYLYLYSYLYVYLHWYSHLCLIHKHVMYPYVHCSGVCLSQSLPVWFRSPKQLPGKIFGSKCLEGLTVLPGPTGRTSAPRLGRTALELLVVVDWRRDQHSTDGHVTNVVFRLLMYSVSMNGHDHSLCSVVPFSLCISFLCDIHLPKWVHIHGVQDRARLELLEVSGTAHADEECHSCSLLSSPGSQRCLSCSRNQSLGTVG